MKEVKPQKSKNPLKKLFIKICRLIGYEIIDQNNFYIPTSNKNLNQTISISGKKSISLPLGEVKISRKVKSLGSGPLILSETMDAAVFHE